MMIPLLAYKEDTMLFFYSIYLLKCRFNPNSALENYYITKR